jgi:phosphoribosylformylglycinamidine (FGAM) synthase-like amidotransferase family enzyme
MLLSGIEFNEKYKNINFYKLTNKSEIHNNFQFQDGINIDTIPFNPHGSCRQVESISQKNLKLECGHIIMDMR